MTEKLKQHGFNDFASSHGNILFQLNKNGKMTMGELAKSINRDKSTATVLVRKLEKEGFVSIINDKNDKRNKNIVLSQKGMEYTKITTEISNELLSTFYKGFSEQEKQTFLDFLERIEKNFEI
ncbi:MAG: MarR family winged helix-turn-helix transcriptional regulator [Treponema sp.]